MKPSRKDVRRKAPAVPEIKFESHALSSFSGLVIWQRFFQLIGLKRRLDQCFRHLSGGKIYSPSTIFFQLIVHLLLGFRELRDRAYYADDPLVQRVLGLKKVPDVATITRMLNEADARSVGHLRGALRGLVKDRLRMSRALPVSRSILTGPCFRQNALRKVRPSASIARRKGPGATTRCSQRSPRQGRSSTSITDRETCMTPTARNSSYCSVCGSCAAFSRTR